MQLVYFWAEEYRNIKISDGIFLSSEYIFCFSKENSKLEISINRNYIPNFYGKNIYDMIAFVGANGSGKTTLAHLIIDHEVRLANPDVIQGHFVQVYKSEMGLDIYYNLENSELKIEKDDDIHINASIRTDKTLGHTLCGLSKVYISNVFNIADENYSNSLFYSPYWCLKNIADKKKQEYGQGWNSYLHNNISVYADYMVNDVLRYYDNFQGELYIKCYEHIPESVRKNLHIFEKYLIGVHQFDHYNVDKNSKVDKNLYDEIQLIKQKFEADKIPTLNFFIQCYLTLLCETYLFFGKTKTKDEEVVESTIGIKIDDYFKTQKFDIDINLLRDISSIIQKMQNGAFEKLDWYQQFTASIPVFETHIKSDFSVGYKEFGASDEILKFYLEECKKEHSIFKRYMIFNPLFTSSGELALTNVFAYLCDAMDSIHNKNVLLVIDEIDAYLHPKWQQLILKSLTDSLVEFYPDCTFQIVFTTHSPIVLSDLTGDRIIKLSMKDKNHKKIEVKKYDNKSFGANIQSLFYDGFFMDEGSIGEIAKGKIKLVLDYLEMEEKGTEEIVENIIDNIGETAVRKQLKLKLDRVTKKKNNSYGQLLEQVNKMGIDKAIDILSKYTEE